MKPLPQFTMPVAFVVLLLISLVAMIVGVGGILYGTIFENPMIIMPYLYMAIGGLSGLFGLLPLLAIIQAIRQVHEAINLGTLAERQPRS